MCFLFTGLTLSDGSSWLKMSPDEVGISNKHSDSTGPWHGDGTWPAFLSPAKVQWWSRDWRKVFPCPGVRSELRDSPGPVLTFLYDNCCSFQSFHILSQLFLVPIFKEKSWLPVKVGRERTSEKHCLSKLASIVLWTGLSYSHKVLPEGNQVTVYMYKVSALQALHSQQQWSTRTHISSLSALYFAVSPSSWKRGRKWNK